MIKYQVGVILCLMCLMASGAAYGFDATTDPDLVGWWSFSEGEGTTVADLSSYGRDGTLEGGATWAQGRFGGGVELDGTSGYVSIPDFTLTTDAITFVAWVKGWKGGDWAPLISSRVVNATEMNFGDNDTLHYTWNNDDAATWSWAGGPVIPQDTWAMLAITMDSTQAVAYVYTDADGLNQATNAIAHVEQTVGALQIGYSYDPRYVQGIMDEAAIYRRALTQAEILTLTQGPKDPALASSPSPTNDSSDILREVVLAWEAGQSAQTHDVYFGTSWQDVNASDPATVAAQGLARDVTSLDVGRLDFGQTYYWRVDEVNAAPDRTVFKGDMWSFTVEPYSIVIPGETISVTASSASNEFSEPTKTVDGSGLGADDAHAMSPETMWFSASPDMDPWIQFEFEGVKKLDTMKVWNSNSAAEMAIGWGVKDVEISYSTDGETWTVLEGTTQFSRAPGNPSYNTYDEIDFGGIAAKLVRLDVASNWGGLLMSYSLSEVQFAAIPAAARTPEPASGSTDVVPNATLEWRAGREAAEHTIYLSSDANAVADGSATSVSSSTNSLDLTPLDLQMDETYYWRVDEVNNAEAVPVWAGPVWSFSTVSALVVDDFESYGNASPDRPFQTWLDGFGYSSDEFFPVGYPGNGTGAGIGYDIWSISSPHYDGDIMERTAAIPGSGQSMPFYYSNSGGVASQTDRKFAVPQDWTVGGAQTLSIMFYGRSGNTGTLFAKINNTKVSYDGNASDLQKSRWTSWHIDLSAQGIGTVNTLTIGVDGANAAGMLLLDDILLYKSAPELVVPVEPTTDSLVAHWALDDGTGTTARDSAGANNGTFEAGSWVSGHLGGALELNGNLTSYVNCGTSPSLDITEAITLSAWVYTSEPSSALKPIIGKGDHSYMLRHGSGETFDFFIYSNGGWHQISAPAPDALFVDTWNHVAGTFDGSQINLYVNGVLGATVDYTGAIATAVHQVNIGRNSEVVDRVYQGVIDDVRIYKSALTAGEILYLSNQ